MASGIYQMIEKLRADRFYADGCHFYACPCCQYPRADLIDMAFVASTGTMVKTGAVSQLLRLFCAG